MPSNVWLNAGSATRATLSELRACGARTVGIGGRLTLGSAASELAEREGWLHSGIPACP